MIPQNEETLFQGQQQQEEQTEHVVTSTEVDVYNNEKKETWKAVSIGGVTGILMGAGVLATQHAFGKSSGNDDEAGEDGNEEQLEGLRVAEVSDELSFGEAFAAARADVGSGGVFHWRGNIYNTFTAEEWQGMSTAERNEFAEQVRPEIRPGEGASHHHTTTHHNDHHQDEPAPSRPSNQRDEHHEEEQQSNQPVRPTSNNNDEDGIDVVIVSSRNVELDSGNVVTEYHADVEGNSIILVDVDQDRHADLLIYDHNENGRVDQGDEMERVQEGSVLGNMEIPQVGGSVYLTDNNNQDVAPDMPDYMDDANNVLV